MNKPLPFESSRLLVSCNGDFSKANLFMSGLWFKTTEAVVDCCSDWHTWILLWFSSLWLIPSSLPNWITVTCPRWSSGLRFLGGSWVTFSDPSNTSALAEHFSVTNPSFSICKDCTILFLSVLADTGFGSAGIVMDGCVCTTAAAAAMVGDEFSFSLPLLFSILMLAIFSHLVDFLEWSVLSLSLPGLESSDTASFEEKYSRSASVSLWESSEVDSFSKSLLLSRCLPWFFSSSSLLWAALSFL